MSFDCSPPAFIVLTYIVGLMALTLALSSGAKWLSYNVVVFHKPRITIAQFGLLIVIAGALISVLQIINIMFGIDKHILDGFIIISLIPLNAFPVACAIWAWKLFS